MCNVHLADRAPKPKIGFSNTLLNLGFGKPRRPLLLGKNNHAGVRKLRRNERGSVVGNSHPNLPSTGALS